MTNYGSYYSLDSANTHQTFENSARVDSHYSEGAKHGFEAVKSAIWLENKSFTAVQSSGSVARTNS